MESVLSLFFPQVSLFLVCDFAEHENLKELICAVRVENPLYDFPFSRSSGFQPSLYKSSQWRLTHSFSLQLVFASLSPCSHCNKDLKTSKTWKLVIGTEWGSAVIGSIRTQCLACLGLAGPGVCLVRSF